MPKFTLSSHHYGWSNKVRDYVYYPYKLGFGISSTTCPQFTNAHPTVSSTTLMAGDEVVVSYSSGGCFQGWFLGIGKTTKYVCIIWIPTWDFFRIVDVIQNPIKAEWTKNVNSPGICLASKYIKEYIKNPNIDFNMDILNEEVHHIS